jgi:uncharacterized protein with HEPN domain
MWRDDACLLDMLIAARKMRLIEILGEAARHLPDDFQTNHPEIPWRQIIGMRNRMVHEYFRVIPAKVWDVVEQEIPSLISLLEPLVPPAGDQGPARS